MNSNNSQPKVRFKTYNWFFGMTVEVESFTVPGLTYEVYDLDKPRAECSCPHFRYKLANQNRGECKHVLRARQHFSRR